MKARPNFRSMASQAIARAKSQVRTKPELPASCPVLSIKADALVKVLQHGDLSRGELYVISGWEPHEFAQALQETLDSGKVGLRQPCAGASLFHLVKQGVSA